MPSRWPDPAPLTVGEALATRLPRGHEPHRGIPELLGDAGVLVPPGDPVALAEALVSLLPTSIGAPRSRLRRMPAHSPATGRGHRERRDDVLAPL